MTSSVVRTFVCGALLAGLIVEADPLAAQSAPQAPVRVSGTRVSVVVPPDFEPLAAAPGFRHSATGSSLVVTEIPGPFAAVRAGLTEQGLAARGLRLLSTEQVHLGSRDVVLLAATQQVGGVPYRTWMALFGGETATVMVVGAYPEAVDATMSAPIRRAVLSATWQPDAVVDAFEGLAFRLREARTLKIAARLSNTLLLTRGGTTAPQPPAEPILVVASSLGEVAVDDIETFAKNRLMQIEQVTAIADIDGRRTVVDGSPAYEIHASARDLKTGAPLRVYQSLAVRGRLYYLAQGLVGAAAADEFLSEFRDVVSSLTFVD